MPYSIKRLLFNLFLIIPITGVSQAVDSLSSEEFNNKIMPIALEYETRERTRLQYLLTAKEMALRSVEEEDLNFQALIAMQAYKFNKAHSGNLNDPEIYKALYQSLKRFKKKSLKQLPTKPDSKTKDLAIHSDSISRELCAIVKRNMTIEEWNKFAHDLPYEQTCNLTYHP